MTTVRDASFDVLRELGMTTLFANPGSTEISLLTDLPEDLEFVLALHESSVVGLATGIALATERPALAILHTTAGLGNAVGALATARVNRAPLVVIVGQQDRRHLAFEPFLTGRLNGLAGDYPVWTCQPERPQDVPGAIGRAHHEAALRRGPALVVVPMDDWSAPMPAAAVGARPAVALASASPSAEAVTAAADLVGRSKQLAVVVGAGLATERGWSAAVRLAERLGCPVFQEAFGARAGFPQDHPLFAGHLPATRRGVRSTLEGFDTVLTIGAPVFRQYPYDDGPFVDPGTRMLMVSDDVAEVSRSPVDLAVHADPAAFADALADTVEPPIAPRPQADDRPSGEGQSDLEPAATPTPGLLFTRLAGALPEDAIVVEETPSSRSELHRLLPARSPLGFVSAAMGGLGFALPAAVGLRMGAPNRPVVAVVGDGSSLYSVQALWSAARYDVGVLFVVLSNGRYAIMDRLASAEGDGAAPWPGFGEVSVSTLAAGFGCPSERVDSIGALDEALGRLLPTLREAKTPLVLDVAIRD